MVRQGPHLPGLLLPLQGQQLGGHRVPPDPDRVPERQRPQHPGHRRLDQGEEGQLEADRQGQQAVQPEPAEVLEVRHRDRLGQGLRRPGVWVFLEKYSNGKDYCLNKNKKWQRVYDSTWDATCYSWWAPVTKGKWKFKVPAGLGKGYFWASAYAVDWADHRSKWKTVSAKITRS
ncbi:hypothetical protein GCM10023107_27070 [Actinoplanes octamycinicus]